MIKQTIENRLSEVLGTAVALEVSRGGFGDFCLTPGTVREISKKLGKNPAEILEIAKPVISDIYGSSAEVQSQYININLSLDAIRSELEEIDSDLGAYLKDEKNSQETIVFDYSSPNIAKPFSVGHLRSTVIGQANYNIHKVLGYKTVGINHLGDWGTQFGKLIVAIKKWGDEEEIKQNPIEHLNKLYVKFHSEAENDEALNDEGRLWFKKLEDGDTEAREIWQKCIDWSFEEFNRFYKLLGVEIDEAVGESFYEDKLQSVIAELKDKNLLRESEGAQIVEIQGMSPALIQKADGATLYMTRDLAALKYRIEKYNPKEIIYHVGNDQSFHFKQLEAVVQKLGWLEREGGRSVKIVFAGHGMVRLPEGKMSTRSGRTILLNDLITEAQKRAFEIIKEKNPDLDDPEKTAKEIGVSAIKYADLSQNRKSDVVFSYDKMISLHGNSAPYLQYSLARINSLNKKAREKFKEFEIKPFLNDDSWPLARKIIQVKSVLSAACETSSPNILADFVFELTNEFNSYYEKSRVISEDLEQTAKNLYIVNLTSKVLSKTFDMLGLVKLEKI